MKTRSMFAHKINPLLSPLEICFSVRTQMRRYSFDFASIRTTKLGLVEYAMMKLCSTYDITGLQNGGQKVRTGRAKNRNFGSL